MPSGSGSGAATSRWARRRRGGDRAFYGESVRPVPRWALLSSVCAPVLLIAGWTVAALLEGPAYDPVTQTISVLAAYGAAGFWVMTGALLALGVCHVLTAWALRAAAFAGRVALGGGGVVAWVVALLPPPSSGGSLRHGSVAVVGFVLLAVWPVLAAHRSGAAPWGLRPVPSLAATVVMGVGAAWFLIEMQRQGAPGVAERLVTSLQSLWPFVVVVSCVRHAGPEEGGGGPGAGC
ncbi:DUF998 domain-containing protein [Streptomyces virens]|uniref:DUF998 domain-containing protein n=1 Tax=Streptomyces virens TaxID=285572 RepID=A0ABP6PRL3_9ACTN|nr:DUF998 domain-containing protein [Streptomyces sp. SID7804]